MHYNGQCQRLETVIYDQFVFGIAWTPGERIYSTSWHRFLGDYVIWKTHKVTGVNSIEFKERNQPQNIGYFIDQYRGKKLFLSTFHFELYH